jgi:hypothetical protein
MSVEATATTSIASIITDLGLHIYNYGVPMPTSVEFLRQEEGLALSGTASGILATSISSGIASTELNGTIAGLKSDYDRKLARVLIASSVINVKMLTQAGVGLLHSLVMGNSSEQLTAWATKQFIPSLFIHGVIAGTVPYFM